MVVIEGPRFSTRAESELFRKWNCDVVGMTICPEAVLAKELGIPYISVAVVTDCKEIIEQKMELKLNFRRLLEGHRRRGKFKK